MHTHIQREREGERQRVRQEGGKRNPTHTVDSVQLNAVEMQLPLTKTRTSLLAAHTSRDVLQLSEPLPRKKT